jgi:membrane protease YdiL (CAAX protease family)
VPGDFWTETQKMATAGLLVAAVAVPVALAARALRPKGEPLLPPWSPWRAPWDGFAVIGAYVVLLRVVPLLVFLLLNGTGFFAAVYGPDFPPFNPKDADSDPQKEANTLRTLWAGLLALPPSLALLWGLARVLYPKWRPGLGGRGSLAAKVALAVFAWLVVTPAVLLFHVAVNETYEYYFRVLPEPHALSRLGSRPALDRALFVLEACVGAPIREELFFRSVLLAWCVGRLRAAGRSPLAHARPWIVMAFAIAFAATEGKTAGPLVFAGVLAVGLAILWWLPRTGARRARAVYATAAMFAVVHSGVWPTPIPLFPLGLALGWLAVRTNGILVPVIVHGLFNAVSAAYILRS